MSDAADAAADWAFEHVGLVLSKAQADRLAVFLAAREAAAFKRGAEAAEEIVMREWPDGVDGCECVCDAIRALRDVVEEAGE